MTPGTAMRLPVRSANKAAQLRLLPQSRDGKAKEKERLMIAHAPIIHDIPHPVAIIGPCQMARLAWCTPRRPVPFGATG